MSIRLDGLVRHLEQSLYPKDKLHLIENIYKWVEHSIHENQDNAEEEANIKKQRLLILRSSIIKRSTVIKKNIETTQKILSNAQDKVNSASASVADVAVAIEAFVHEHRNNKNQTNVIDSVREERRIKIANMRVDQVACKRKLADQHDEAQKHIKQIHLLEHEMKHLLYEIEGLDSEIIHQETLIQNNLDHHQANEAKRPYLERRQTALRLHKMQRACAAQEAHKRQIAQLDLQEKKRQLLRAAMVPTPPLSKKRNKGSKTRKITKITAATKRAKEYREQLNEYLKTPAPTNGQFGRTSPRHTRWRKQIQERPSKWNKRPSDKRYDTLNADERSLPKSWGPQDMRRPRIKKNVENNSTKDDNSVKESSKEKNEILSVEPSNVSLATESIEELVENSLLDSTAGDTENITRYGVGSNVWVQYKRFPEYYAAKIKHVHNLTNNGTELYDVMYEDGTFEMGITSDKLRIQTRSSRAASILHVDTKEEHDRTVLSLREEEELAEEHEMDKLFREALTHTNWGRDFRNQWDAETKLAMLSEINQENKMKQVRLRSARNIVQATDSAYSYLDGVFNDSNPPIGRHRNYWIAPQGSPKLAQELPKLKENSVDEAVTDENGNGNDNDGEYTYHMDENCEIFDRPEQTISSIPAPPMSMAFGFMARLELSTQTAASLPPTALMNSKVLVGGVPRRCDMASSKLHKNYLLRNNSPHRPKNVSPWKFNRSVIKRQRQIRAPLHSPR